MQTTLTKFFPVLRAASVPLLRETALRASAPRRKIQTLITSYTSNKLLMPPALPDGMNNVSLPLETIKQASQVNRYFLRTQYRNRDLPAPDSAPLPFPKTDLNKNAVEANRRAIAYEAASAASGYRKYWDRFGALYTEDGEREKPSLPEFPHLECEEDALHRQIEIEYEAFLRSHGPRARAALTNIIPAEAWYLYRHVGDGTLHFRASQNSPWLSVYELSVMKDIAEAKAFSET
ncbi:hypothetical protein R3P38DRAFT_3214095 [Favolaschia claudopus]|uniref:Uncharacterized protein n=1 Tax=Favolaschia claudopus TaxID=2862362 RepID=A0AAW0ACI9_9AGAR